MDLVLLHHVLVGIVRFDRKLFSQEQQFSMFSTMGPNDLKPLHSASEIVFVV